MRVGVGYSENPETAAAGRQAVLSAQEQAGRNDPCDMVMLFATARHDAVILRQAVADIVGEAVPVVGGGAIGAITNDAYGYAGDQIVLALLWLEGSRCDIVTEGGLTGSEAEVGRRLGRALASRGVTKDSQVLLFYDAIDRTQGGMRMVMATYLLAAMEESLGFLPDLNGAGMQGDYLCTPTRQWLGDKVGEHSALALVFSGAVRVDSIIMHGCRPATAYYTVTKADRQTILEINGEPALLFMEKLLGEAVPPEKYPFFFILGVNRGEKWGEFDANNYASRLCLAIDKERNGIVMFEPDMVTGTEFQIMYRSLNLDYMAPEMERLFSSLKDREPVFALYIDCGGRAAGFGGTDMEDAVVVQNAVAGRVPLLGMYTGVEIAAVQGRPRSLDWTGVFCLFSVPK
ncbi:Diguanylate cyclase (fragment) [uncultured delta proteobacterium]|uniref:Diguanylate cyclase n=1 Tax=uncultured delta proteobacterium TaxID=34034 RepID=A0A212IYB9_9DELT